MVNKQAIEMSLMEAEGFVVAANCLRKEISQDGFKAVLYGQAYTVNLSFACELYLKQLLIIEGKIAVGDKRTGHKLLELYERIDSNTQREINEQYCKKCTQHVQRGNNRAEIREIPECLLAYNNAFEDWRYWYEGNKESTSYGWVDFHMLIDSIKEIVLAKLEQCEEFI